MNVDLQLQSSWYQATQQTVLSVDMSVRLFQASVARLLQVSVTALFKEHTKKLQKRK